MSEPAPGSGLGRELMADWSWLKANQAWESCDADLVRGLTAMSVRLAPTEPYFRLNGARMRAFDFPVWQERDARDAPAALRERWRRRAGEEALAFLLADVSPEPEVLIEAGNIALYALREPGRAADFFGRAAAMAEAPWHAGRIYAELLHKTGRTREAVAWLRAWLPRLSAADPAAQREVVVRRLAELERELGAGSEAF